MVWLAAFALEACAEGYAVPELGVSAADTTGLPAPDAGAATGEPADSGAQTTAMMGTPCTMGSTQPCTCDNGGEGVNVCAADPSLPSTSGYFATECTSCGPPPDTSGGAAGGTADAGTGVAEPGGGVGGGDTGGGRSCDPAACPAGALGEPACCTAQGICGIEVIIFGCS